MGSTEGVASVGMYNRVYDLTVVLLVNGVGAIQNEYVFPLFDSGFIGAQFPCVDEALYPEDECTVGLPY
jgi:hypothetical protein